jgi:hypothetical protein
LHLMPNLYSITLPSPRSQTSSVYASSQTPPSSASAATLSDMQRIDRMLTSIDIEENYASTGHTLNAKNLHKYLTKVLYKRRTGFNQTLEHAARRRPGRGWRTVPEFRGSAGHDLQCTDAGNRFWSTFGVAFVEKIGAGG